MYYNSVIKELLMTRKIAQIESGRHRAISNLTLSLLDTCELQCSANLVQGCRATEWFRATPKTMRLRRVLERVHDGRV